MLFYRETAIVLGRDLLERIDTASHQEIVGVQHVLWNVWSNVADCLKWGMIVQDWVYDDYGDEMTNGSYYYFEYLFKELESLCRDIATHGSERFPNSRHISPPSQWWETPYYY